jgi:hypothetical protein
MPLAMLGTLFALTLVLFLLVRLPRRELRGRSLTLLRCVFPAWRFFEEITAVPTLSHRLIDASGAHGPWRQTLPRPERRLGMWGLHAAGNLYLAYQSLVEQLADELEDLAENSDQIRCVSYQLVQALVLWQLRVQPNAPAAGQYQFCLSDGETAAPLWVSALHAL